MARFTTNFQSEALKRPISIEIIIPSDHAVMMTPGAGIPKRNKPFKTLYLLEGVTGNASGPFNYSNMMPLVEDYNLAVVCLGGENKWWGNSDFTGDCFSDMVIDAVNFTRSAFNLSQKREDTFIGGFSMGGYGTFVIGFQHPELFSHIISMNAALNKPVILGSSNEVTWDLFFKRHYEAMFGCKDISEYENSENDYEYLAGEVAKKMTKEELPRVFISAGTEDGLYQGSVDYSKMLKDLGYDVTWVDVEGNHSWYSFEKGIEAAVKWLPTEDNFCGNMIYYGRNAHIDATNYAHWNSFYNIEARERAEK